MGKAYSPQYSDEIVGFSRRRISELLGVGLLALAGFMAISLVSYSPSDPSLNISSSFPVSNWGGVVGAIMADLLLQTMGIASILPVILCLAWGARLFGARRVTRLWLRIVAFLFSLIAFSTLIAYFEAPLAWPVETGMGGAIGMLVKYHLSGVISNAGLFFISLFVFVVATPVALGLRRSEWKKMWQMARRGIFYMLLLLGFLKPSRLTSVTFDQYPSEDSRSLWSRMVDRFAFWRERAAVEEWDDEEELPEEEIESPVVRTSPRLTKRQAKKLIDAPQRKSKKAKRAAQGTFQLLSGSYEMPSFELLSEPSKKSRKIRLDESALAQNARLLETVLQDFGVQGEIVKIRPGPVITMYELEPSPGTKSARVIGLADDIARSMSAISARISVIPGRNAIGIELPNSQREMVVLREMIEDEDFASTDAKLPLALGKDIGGSPIVVDLARMPHLLVAGTTGSGKSVAVNTMITSLLYRHTPEECKFIMIDPKMLELSIYDGIPHLLSPVVTEPGKAVVALKWTVKEMENRYRLMSSLGVRNVEGYNRRIEEAKARGDTLTRTVQTGFDPETGKPIYEEQPLEMTPLPFIVVVVDEMADLMVTAGKEIEASIQRLAQMARAAGIHIIMATQRPSVDVITGVIKANFPTRISFQVTSRIDSRTILGEQGAEQLLGQGDMLYMAGGGRLTRIHAPFISDSEVQNIVNFLKEQGTPSYVEAVTEEEQLSTEFGDDDESDEDKMLYDKAVEIVYRDGKASTSYIQRCLKIGYNRAARLIEKMEREGVVSAANHVGKREVLAR